MSSSIDRKSSPQISPRPSRIFTHPKCKLSFHLVVLFSLGCIYFIQCRDNIFRPLSNQLDFSHVRRHCTDIPGIEASEFYARQKKLAEILHKEGASAYVAEPGANAMYFANISQNTWHLSERPFLLIVSALQTSRAEIVPKITILAPMFELGRAKLLPIAASNISFVPWAEGESPYKAAVSSLSNGTIFISESTRLFIKDGIEEAASPNVIVSAPQTVRILRERKSSAEVALLRCVNEATLLVIREVRSMMYLGIRQSDASQLTLQGLLAAGFSNPSAIVLFGPNAALPHGGPTDRPLKANEFALFDVGATYHGYTSDITRTFAVDNSNISPDMLSVWQLVLKAQNEALSAAKEGVMAHTVDEMARNIIMEAGYGKYFTHRLGHGIGLEGHEAPYLRGGSMDILQKGNTFSDEPGVYVPNQFGIRLEDCFVIDQDGKAVYLTEAVGGAARSPWDI